MGKCGSSNISHSQVDYENAILFDRYQCVYVSVDASLATAGRYQPVKEGLWYIHIFYSNIQIIEVCGVRICNNIA